MWQPRRRRERSTEDPAGGRGVAAARSRREQVAHCGSSTTLSARRVAEPSPRNRASRPADHRFLGLGSARLLPSTVHCLEGVLKPHVRPLGRHTPTVVVPRVGAPLPRAVAAVPRVVVARRANRVAARGLPTAATRNPRRLVAQAQAATRNPRRLVRSATARKNGWPAQNLSTSQRRRQNLELTTADTCVSINILRMKVHAMAPARAARRQKRATPSGSPTSS